jgi:thioredoxin 1
MRKNYSIGLLIAEMLLSVGSFAQQSQLLKPADFKKIADSATGKQIIDVRTPEEFQSGHIADAVNINFYDEDFPKKMAKLNKQQPIFVYCKAGGRSAEAVALLQKKGFTHVYDLEGGIMSWENSSLPVTANPAPAHTAFTTTDFDTLLTNNTTLVIDFYAPWCGPCKKIEPVLHKLSEKYAGKITFFRINLDEAKNLARQLRIQSIPVVAAYKNGRELQRLMGLQSASKLEALAKLTLKD